MNTIWIVSMALQWVLILALCLLVFSLVRQLGEITLRLNSSGGAPAKEPEEPFKPYSAFPELTVPLVNGGTFACGGRQNAPSLIVFFSASCISCAEMPDAIREFSKHIPSSEFYLLAVIRIERNAVKRYIDERSLGQVNIAIESDVPDELKIGRSPFAVAVTSTGQIAANGKPKQLTHLLEMAQAARAMAELTPSHSRRKHEWGESAPYWDAVNNDDKLQHKFF
jgi:hypothetical protein